MNGHGTAAAVDDIVVVDDDEMVAEFARRVLRGSGRTLRAFSDPHVALEHLLENTPRVLLVDTRMPGMSGTELIGRLADGGHLDGVRTILCSAGRSQGDAAEHPGVPSGLERLTKEVLYDRATLLERLSD